MTEGQKIFNPVTTKLLTGVNLVEASAGTGKTYAIAMLVLRLIVEQSLKIDEILLVTFTRAATQELADRIRMRLQQASECLQGFTTESDQVLLDYVNSINDKTKALKAINEALLDVDRAAIFTIHGFCQRMLQEQALESSQLFDVELQPEIGEIRLNIARDFWRKNIYSLPKRLCSVVLSFFDTPEKLYNSISSINHTYSRIEPEYSDFNKAVLQINASFDALANWWTKHSKRLSNSLQELINEGKLKSGFCSNFSLWQDELNNFFMENGEQIPSLEYLRWLGENGFIGIINGNKVRGSKKIDLLASLELPGRETEHLFASISEMILSLRRNFAVYLLEETEKSLQVHNCMSYDDLVVRLHRAVSGSAGQLPGILQKRFKAALIDEFQDTDLFQWQIFSTLFSTGNHYLYLIGDPKQSIYGFRGADIYSYFLARGSADQRLTLKNNYRSHPSLVTALNTLFHTRDKSFVYDTSTLDYEPVDAALLPHECDLREDSRSIAGLVYCQLDSCSDSTDGRWNVGEASASIQHYVTAEISRLLGNRVTLVDKGTTRHLRPGDIAILVKTHNQAEEYQHCLLHTGIPAVLTSKQSIFHSDECFHLYSLLQAIAEPGNTELLKRAMVIPWFGLQGDQLYTIWNDEHQFHQFQSQFHEYFELWKNSGVFAMMKHLLKNAGVLRTIGLLDLAERKIANINHLLELVQHEETDSMAGPMQLLQWLRGQMERKAGEEELRLESDDEAVKIVTMHSAKGLEYPIVFSPYLWYRRKKQIAENSSISCNTDEGRVLDLGSENFESRVIIAENENLAEEMRLLYVAVTRAKLRSYVFWADVKSRKNGPYDAFESSLGYLLFPEGRMSFDKQQQRLQQAGEEDSGDYELINTSEQSAISHGIAQQASEKLQAKIASQNVYTTERQMTSYSALAASGEHIPTHIKEDEIAQQSGRVLDFSDLPSGAQFGNVIHDILEQFSFKELAEPQVMRADIEKIVTRYRVDLDMELLEKMLTRIVRVDLSSQIPGCSVEFSLADLDETTCLKEMGFYYHLNRGQAGIFNRLLTRERTFTAINDKTLEGYLTGFIDLVFQHDGQFYIADYKTNHLGYRAENYSSKNLEDAMVAHNYGLQYWLYSLVLHRHLKNFYSGYDYRSHFGGILYLFVRGMEAEGKGIYYRKPDLKTLELLAKSFGER